MTISQKKQMVTTNSGAQNRASGSHPTTNEEDGCFTNRLRIILKGRSSRSFAREAGVSETVFRKYLAAESEPTRPALISMAAAGGVSVGWLAAGEQAESGSPPQVERPSADLLRRAVIVLDRVLDDVAATTDASGRAELLVAIYEMLEQGAALDAAQRVVAAMLRAASRATGVQEKQG